ncbi:ABC transporter permease [Bradyrhizobium prioriisuperbiae]|uniref:ABC transporter permease n=1 Tax=Bradyrhizobium prioriisuperbiae TaxID=2854389 RepID=UPI0028EA4DCC|nr:ABC transporter permease subunit [Bradyrhizobium prioritasuperba]
MLRSASELPAKVGITILGALGFVLAWEALGHVPVSGVRIFPPLSGVIGDVVANSDLYWGHVAATAATSTYGFLIGTSIASVAALVFCLFPTMERLFRSVNIALFAVPAIAIGPLLVLLLDGRWPQIVLSATMIYFPTMVSMLVGLRDIDPRHADLVKAYGGGEIALLRLIRLRSAMPGVLAGLRVAASLSVLGAILGEFGSGERWGLGTFLLGSLGQSNADRLWGISIAAAALALTGYGLFSLGSSMVGATIPVTVAAGRMPDELHGQDGEAGLKRYLMLIASVALPFVLWWAVLKWADVSPIVAPRPLDIVSYLTFADGSDEARSALLHAVGQTIPMALLGLFVGLGIAFLLAALSVVMPGLLKVILPAAMVLQSTPLVALTPIVLLLLGRTISACIFMAVVVVFFPAFVLLIQGFAVVPRAALETVEVYGGGPIQKLRFISIPYSFRYIAAAAKLVAPRALLGVMIAEWLLTGTGLGNLMDISRGSLDYGMVWSGAVLSIVISVLAYRGADLLERSIYSGRAA